MDPSCASFLHSLSCLFEVICLFLCVLVRPSLVSSFALSFCGNTGVSIFCTHNSHSQESNWFATTLIWTDNQQLQWKIDQELNSCHQQAVNTRNGNTPRSILYKSTQCLVGGLLEALDLEPTAHSILCTVLGSLEALNLVAEPYFGRSDHQRQGGG